MHIRVFLPSVRKNARLRKFSVIMSSVVELKSINQAYEEFLMIGWGFFHNLEQWKWESE